MIGEFATFSSLAEGLVNEVKLNISKGLRPAEELTYIENIESFLEYVEYTYSLVEGLAWEDSIWVSAQITPYPTYIWTNNSKLSETCRLLVGDVIEQVRTYCYDFYEAVYSDCRNS